MRLPVTLASSIPSSSPVLGLLNLRGEDSPYTPVFFSYLVLHYNHEGETSTFSRGTLYTKDEKLDSKVKDYLKALNIDIKDYEDIGEDLLAIKDVIAYVDKSYCNSFVFSCLKNATNLVEAEPPIVENLKV